MNILDYAILFFVIMESANVIILYFTPDSRLGNGVAVFNPWFKLKGSGANELFVRYLVNWVAGVKLIFIVLLIAILLFGNEVVKVWSVVAMILSIATYFFRLNPLIKMMDQMDEITPNGYSKILFWMIIGFMLMFSGALVYYLVF